MNYKNKLMGLSLIIVAMFSACSDEVENGGRDSSTGDHRITFAVSTQNQTNGTRSAFTSETHELGSVKMEGKLDGKPVYLTAEVSDGFPGDDQPLTRGTQVDAASQIDEFGMSAYMSGDNTPVIYNAKVTNKKVSSVWIPDETFYWPSSDKTINLMDFFAWYPYKSDNLSISAEGSLKLSLNYEIPKEAIKQQDVMIASASHKSEASSIPLTFNHMLTAVKFKTSTDMPTCIIKTLSLKGVKYKGSYTAWGNGSYPTPWNLDADTTSFTLEVNKKITVNTETELTGEGETFFMMPQVLDDNARLEVNLVMNGVEQTLGVNLKDISTRSRWMSGTTVTYKLSISKLSAEVTFFKGTNGADGNSYTSHNISANGDPFTVDLKAPASVNAITARLAYEVTDGDGNKTYEVFQDNLDLTGKTTADFTSPRMNNVGDGPDKAKKDETPFVVQIKVNSTASLTMPSDPNDPDTKRTYIPGTDDNTWYTIWRGTMFPPNYIQDYNSDPKYVIVARKDGTFGPYNETESHEYWEVDKNHPIYGQGKWQIINPTWSTKLRLVYWIYELTQNGQCPGNNEIYGEPLQKKDGDIWYWVAAAPTSDLTKCYLITGVGKTFVEMGNYVSGYQVGIDWKTTSHNFRYAILKSSL